MTDNELLLAISNIMDEKLKNELQPLKKDVQDLKNNVPTLNQDAKTLNNCVTKMNHDIQELMNRITKIELTLENEMNRNIQLLAENHINLIDKLNAAMKVQDKSILYEVQISGLKTRIEIIERELKELKTVTA